MNLNDIKKHWEEVGKQYQNKGGISPTSRDPFLAKLERENILNYLESNSNVLEIGCGDASHTIEYAQNVNHITAIDLSENLLKLAEKNRLESGAKNIELHQLSVLDLKEFFKNRQFDIIISQRCLINLSQWEYQKEALYQIHHLLKKEGLLLMTESFNDEMKTLNKERTKYNLNPIKVVDYNRNFENLDFNDFISNIFATEKILDYGFYLYLSRIYHPLVVEPEMPKHDSPLNKIAALLATQNNHSEFKKYSYNLLYILRKI